MAVVAEADPALAKPSHRARWLAVIIITLLLAEVALSLWRPVTFPRLRFLPEPAETSWTVNPCGNTARRYWDPKGVFWVSEVFTDTGWCIRDMGQP